MWGHLASRATRPEVKAAIRCPPVGPERADPPPRPLAPGSPLCRGNAPGRALDGLEIALKGGQGGGPAYFNQVRDGGA